MFLIQFIGFWFLEVVRTSYCFHQLAFFPYMHTAVSDVKKR